MIEDELTRLSQQNETARRIPVIVGKSSSEKKMVELFSERCGRQQMYKDMYLVYNWDGVLSLEWPTVICATPHVCRLAIQLTRLVRTVIRNIALAQERRRN